MYVHVQAHSCTGQCMCAGVGSLLTWGDQTQVISLGTKHLTTEPLRAPHLVAVFLTAQELLKTDHFPIPLAVCK